MNITMSIGLIDANNSYASVERAFDPALNGRPIVVVGNNDGIIVARNPDDVEVRRFSSVGAFDRKA